MKKVLVAAFLLLVPYLAFAEWKVELGIKVGSLHDDQVGIIATLPAKSTFKGVSAYLQVECLEHPEVTTRIVSIVTSKGTVPKLMMWSYQLDDRPPVLRGPHSRLSMTVIALGDSSSEEIKGTVNCTTVTRDLDPHQRPAMVF